jgi:hypothetical protein
VHKTTDEYDNKTIAILQGKNDLELKTRPLKKEEEKTRQEENKIRKEQKVPSRILRNGSYSDVLPENGTFIVTRCYFRQTSFWPQGSIRKIKAQIKDNNNTAGVTISSIRALWLPNIIKLIRKKLIQ